MDKRLNGFKCKDLFYHHNHIFWRYGFLVNYGTQKLDDLTYCNLLFVYGAYKCNLHAQALHMWINVKKVNLRVKVSLGGTTRNHLKE
jgi:hypothetical protein